jgi:hypothetical protein
MSRSQDEVWAHQDPASRPRAERASCDNPADCAPRIGQPLRLMHPRLHVDAAFPQASLLGGDGKWHKSGQELLFPPWGTITVRADFANAGRVCLRVRLKFSLLQPSKGRPKFCGPENTPHVIRSRHAFDPEVDLWVSLGSDIEPRIGLQECCDLRGHRFSGPKRCCIRQIVQPQRIARHQCLLLRDGSHSILLCQSGLTPRDVRSRASTGDKPRSKPPSADVRAFTLRREIDRFANLEGVQPALDWCRRWLETDE